MNLDWDHHTESFFSDVRKLRLWTEKVKWLQREEGFLIELQIHVDDDMHNNVSSFGFVRTFLTLKAAEEKSHKFSH